MTDTRGTILLVEDDPLLRHAFRLLLEDAGYGVREAGTAGEAIESAAVHVPDLVILDLGLPDRSGLDVARELSRGEATRKAAIVALTGRVGPEQERACIEAGCTDYLAKPVEPRELLRRVPEFIKRH
jgi:DNA-binding response OmpR family regulator